MKRKWQHGLVTCEGGEARRKMDVTGGSMHVCHHIDLDALVRKDGSRRPGSGNDLSASE